MNSFFCSIGDVVSPVLEYLAGVSLRSVPVEKLSLIDILALSWAVIVLTLLVVMALRVMGLYRATRNACSASFDIPLVMIDDLGKTVSRARIMTGSEVTVPFVSGFFRPRIFLPESASEWTREELLMVIRHEMAHVARIDQPVIIIQNIVQAVFFFNPLVWFMNYRLNLLREIVCDDISLRNSPGDVWKYCRLILRNVMPAGNLDNPHPLSSSFGINGSLVRSRLLYLTRRRKDAVMYEMSKIQKSLIVAIIAVSALFLFGFELVAEGDDQGKSGSTVSAGWGRTMIPGERRSPFHSYDVGPKPLEDLTIVLAGVEYPGLPPGKVSAMVWVEIGEDGRVVDADFIVSSHDPAIFKPGLDALKKVKWVPAQFEGTECRATLAVPLRFGEGSSASEDSSEGTPVSPLHKCLRSFDYTRPVGVILDAKGGDPDYPDELKVSVCDTPPEPKSAFNVKYPDSAVKEGLSGRVVVSVKVGKDGKVIEAAIIESSGHMILDNAARESIMEVIWIPGSDKGNVVEAWVAVPVDFKLE